MVARVLGFSVFSVGTEIPLNKIRTASVSGEFFAHPESKYFSLEKVGKDQIEDYARRKGVSVEVIEQFIPSNLNYKGL
jgi:5-methyltetrahydrofolate--homocysteine methyltransferase